MERRIGEGIGTLGLSLLLAAVVLAVLAAAGPAGATLPGANGKMAYASGGIWVAGPDGTRIAFTRLNGCHSLKTVQNHVSNIFRKLRVADRVQAALRAREAGLGG